MGVFDKFKDLVGIEDIDDDEDEEEEVVEQKPVERPMPRPSFEPARVSQPAPAAAAPVQPREPRPDLSKTFGRATTASDIMKMIVVEPQGFDECPRLVDSLKAKKPVVINLENLETDVARKIFDFLSGATYALNGNVQKIANNIFVFAPSNVDVTSNPNKMNHTAEEKIKSPWN